MMRPADVSVWPWSAALLVTLVFHYAWEMAQAPWFENFAGDSFYEHLWPCFRAAAGDVGIAAIAFAVTAAIFHRWNWPFVSRWQWPGVVWIATGLALTVVIERWSLSAGRWSYTDEMPTVAGIGVLPLVQWIVVPAACLGVLRAIDGRQRTS